jgi:NAD(P)-dependent dehydrogenase (short-subunit alcohol dehydrogenase family)
VNGPFSLDGELVVVTGAKGKLGPVWIEAAVDAGAVVAAVDRPHAGASAAFTAVTERAGADRLQIYECDITDRTAIEAVRDRVVAELGTPTVLVNNAGIDQPPDSGGGSGRYTIDRMPVELFRSMVEVNLLGTFQMIQVFGALMAARGAGSIVNIGSLYASVSPDQRFYDHLPGEPPFLKVPSYGASKAAVVQLTKYFATLWGQSGVRVNTLSPGGVLSDPPQHQEFRRKFCDRVPLGRMAESADLKGPLVFLASRASSYVTGHELRVDGGFTAW